MTTDYYAVLEISPDASQEDVKRAYKRMALKWHPDKNADNRAEAERRFRQISEAYEVLSCPDRRGAYDSRRRGGGGGYGGSADFAFNEATEVFRKFFHDPWVLWADAEKSEWEDLFSGSGQNPSRQNFASTKSVSTAVNWDGTNETVRQTVIEDGVKTVTVIRNGEEVERTVTNVGGAGIRSGILSQQRQQLGQLTSSKKGSKQKK